MAESNGSNVGRVEQVTGVVVDAVFPDELPEIYSAVKIEMAGDEDRDPRQLGCRLAQEEVERAQAALRVQVVQDDLLVPDRDAARRLPRELLDPLLRLVPHETGRHAQDSLRGLRRPVEGRDQRVLLVVASNELGLG